MIVSDSDYLDQLEIIRKIRDIVTSSDEVNLPQICVIGDQSSGKSSFLSRLTGVSFPTAAKMCTKAATVVTCTRDTTLQSPKYEIEDTNKRGSYMNVESTSEAIQRAQDILLGNAAGVDENRIVTDAAIKLRVSGPDLIDIIIVDLPGIQHAGPTKEAITALIEKNIEKPETLNLIVSEAKQDTELTNAIELAAKYDPNCERTLRVLSKFDNFDTPDTRDRAVHWIKDGLGFGSPQDIGGLAHQVNLGPHAVISIDKDGKLRSGKDGDQTEKQQLVDEFGLPDSRSGIVSLKARLQPLFAILIKQNLPVMKQRVSARLNETLVHLDKVGETPPSPFDIMVKCQDCLLENTNAFEIKLGRDSFTPMKAQILAVGKKITLEFATVGFEPNPFECILFQGETTFDEAAKRIRELWEPIVNDFIKRTKEIALESIHSLQNNEHTNMYGSLISVIHAEYQNYVQREILPRFQKACIQSLCEERFFGTTNHYFNSKFHEDELCPEELIERFTQLVDDQRQYITVNGVKDCYVKASQMKQCLEKAKVEVASEIKHSDLVTSQKNRIFAAVKAHFDVEKKTFADILLKKTKDIIVKGERDWIQRELLRSSKIFAAANEDEHVKKLREDLIEKRRRLDECMDLLRDVALPVAEASDTGKRHYEDRSDAGWEDDEDCNNAGSGDDEDCSDTGSEVVPEKKRARLEPKKKSVHWE